MEDKKIEVGKTVLHHRELENNNYASNLAVGFAQVNYDGESQKFWLTNRENVGGYEKRTGITGDLAGLASGHPTTVTNDGKPIYRNTLIGEYIIRNTEPSYSVPTPGGVRTLEVKDTCFYRPHPHSSNAFDLKFIIKGRKPAFFGSLHELLKNVQDADDELRKLQEQQLKLEEQEQEEQLTQLLKRIGEAEHRKKNALEKAQSFIRKHAELRHQPILDPWQEEIKRSHLYDKTVAINGGPGTGKTTSLIQRIKFLLDEKAMEEYMPKLSNTEKDKLFKNGNNWMFFSPNELLKLFLRNNMTAEGLMGDDSRVMVWDDYKSTLAKKYKLFNPETQGPFLLLRKFNDVHLLPTSPKQLRSIVTGFDSFYLQHQNDKLQKLLGIDVSSFEWKRQGSAIQQYINRQEKDYTVPSLIRLYFNIQETFGEEVQEIMTELLEMIRHATAKLVVVLGQNPTVKSQLLTLIEEWKSQNQTDDEDDEEDEDEENEPISTSDLEQLLFKRLLSLIRKIALKKFDDVTKLTARDKALIALIEPVAKFEDLSTNFDALGQKAFFAKYFAKSARGVAVNLVSETSRLYKGFRRAELASRKNKWNYTVLDHIINQVAEKNKRLHADEQAFLLSFINGLVVNSYKTSRIKSRQIKHAYFDAYREASRPVIGVDEATDFHLIDLLAIHSLGDFEISSVTYSGDLMQRLTKGGIRSWKDLSPFIRNFEVKELQVSYRQSPTLLEVATSIYNQATGSKAEYLSFTDKDEEREPKPLVFKDEDENARIEWISKRILDIYKAYGRTIPSIAIFLSDENELESFSSKLGEIDRLADVDIKVKPCINGLVLGDPNTIRVFSVDHIKGLEFEAVFYHDIHKMFSSTDKDLLLRNLYVGLSRASFYLGVTMESDMAELSFLDDYLIEDNKNWEIGYREI
jgi:hypothetical protein